ncbi:MAG: class D sortase [Acidobacteriia bacterium]|nr:class D sortase [Terriglobia bacterium]
MNHTDSAHAARGMVACALRTASGVLLLIGLAAVGYAAYVIEYARTYQAVQERILEAAPASVAPRIAEPPAEGSTLGRLQIPRLGLRVIVVQGDSPQILKRAVGHLPETTLPGEDGNAALAGHRDTLFRPLRGVRAGDAITFETPSRVVRYQVEWTQVVAPTSIEVLRSSGAHELTLITCFPFDFVGSAPNRFIVRAREVDQEPR